MLDMYSIRTLLCGLLSPCFRSRRSALHSSAPLELVLCLVPHPLVYAFDTALEIAHSVKPQGSVHHPRRRADLSPAVPISSSSLFFSLPAHLRA